MFKIRLHIMTPPISKFSILHSQIIHHNGAVIRFLIITFVKFKFACSTLRRLSFDYPISELSLFDFKDYRRPPCTLNMTDFENPCSNDYAFQHRYLLLYHQLLNCNIKFADKIVMFLIVFRWWIILVAFVFLEK